MDAPPAPAPVATRYYSPQIDALRFVAALMVIVHHAPLIPGTGALKAIGWIGVDLFLCISAYLLTNLIRLELRRTGNLRIGFFFVRRALRIWPLYFGYAAVMCTAAVLFFDQPVRAAGGWMLSHLSFSANILTALKGFSPVPFTAHLWTISLEEQAYFVIPMLLLAVSRAIPSRRRIIVATALILLAMTIARSGLWLAGAAPDAIMVLPFRADGIVYGVAAALVFEERQLPNKLLCWALAAVAGVTAAVISLNEETLGGAMLVVYSLVIGGCLAALLATVQSNFTFRPLVYLGKISYGIYIYHLLMIRVAERGLETAGITSPVAVLALSVGLTIAASAASYHLYEARFLRLKDRFAVVLSRPV